VHVEVIETPSLGDRSYLVHDGEVALVVDPQRDIDRVLDLAKGLGVGIDCVAETHLHNDYVSGGLVLSRVTGARYVHAAAEDVRMDHESVSDGDELTVGTLHVTAVHTPGHTHHHLSYVVRPTDGPPAVFTGGSLLYGTVGRTDLVGEDQTDELTRAQFRSVRRIAEALPDDALVYPTHGFGSFCASASADVETDGTLGSEREVNLALVADTEDDFVDQLVAGLDDHPRYYAHMGPLNAAGPLGVDLSAPVEVDPVELRRRVHAGEWVVDLRDRRLFASAHLTGTIGIELDDPFATYVGWLIPWGTPLTLLADEPEHITEAQRQLVRIGIDRPSGAATGGIDAWTEGGERRSYPVVDFAALAAAQDRGRELTVVDLRRRSEFDEGHIDGAINVPIHQLLARMHELPHTELWVHCETGFRSSIGASLLDRAGRRVVLIDDELEHAPDAGIVMSP